MQKTVFLDRDGVINRRIIDDYVTSIHEFEILPGVLDCIAKLTRAGFRVVVVTNQRGIAIGRMTQDAVDAVHQWFQDQLATGGTHIDGFYICPHDRHVGCACRKPKAGLLDQADGDVAVAWDQSFLVGDSDSDILAGKARKVKTIKVAGPSEVNPDYLCADLVEATQLILGAL